MEPSHSGSFEDHPRNINFIYNQLEHGIDEQLPQEKIKPEKYILVGIFFFFAIGIMLSLILLVNNITREQKANSVSATEVTIVPNKDSN